MDNGTKDQHATAEELHRKWFGSSTSVADKDYYPQEYWLGQPYIGRVVETTTSGSDALPNTTG